MENTKNHGSQSHTKDNATDSKNKKQGQHGKTGSENNAGANAGTKMNVEDDDTSAVSNKKGGSKSGSR